MKKMLVSVAGERARVAVWDDGQLAELLMDGGASEQLAGNIYRARIVDVLPAMQAAFVDIGWAKNAYLYVDDAWPGHEASSRKPNIRELVQCGEVRLVQVTREATGTKAPRVTTNVSLPGRTLVYLPFGQTVSVSRKIGNEQERERLGQLGERLKLDGEGLIIRTQAEGAREEQLAAELEYLRTTFQEAMQAAKNRKPPCLLYRESDAVSRAIRESLSAEVAELVVDHLPTYRRVQALLAALYPEWQERLTFYQGKQPLFELYGVDAEIDKAMQRQVRLRSGGFLVIDQTEAMTVIDVNTGKFTGKSAQELEETVTQLNLEAAREIVRQLILRDIGGIVVIDFIDMKSRDNQERVLSELRRELARDRTPAQVLGITRLGLVEMTRKRVRPNLTEQLTEPCPACGGEGRVLSGEESVLRLGREMRSLLKASDKEAIVVELPPRLYEQMLREREGLEKEMQVRLFMTVNHDLPPDKYRIPYVGSVQEADRLYRQRPGKSLD